jgi:hypothetical protein
MNKITVFYLRFSLFWFIAYHVLVVVYCISGQPVGPMLKGRAVLDSSTLENGKPEILPCSVYWEYGKNIFCVFFVNYE